MLVVFPRLHEVREERIGNPAVQSCWAVVYRTSFGFELRGRPEKGSLDVEAYLRVRSPHFSEVDQRFLDKFENPRGLVQPTLVLAAVTEALTAFFRAHENDPLPEDDRLFDFDYLSDGDPDDMYAKREFRYFVEEVLPKKFYVAYSEFVEWKEQLQYAGRLPVTEVQKLDDLNISGDLSTQILDFRAFVNAVTRSVNCELVSQGGGSQITADGSEAEFVDLQTVNMKVRLSDHHGDIVIMPSVGENIRLVPVSPTIDRARAVSAALDGSFCRRKKRWRRRELVLGRRDSGELVLPIED